MQQLKRTKTAMLSVFRWWFDKTCPGTGLQTAGGGVIVDEDGTGHLGSCPECGRVRPVDIFDEGKMLPHRK